MPCLARASNKNCQSSEFGGVELAQNCLQSENNVLYAEGGSNKWVDSVWVRSS